MLGTLAMTTPGLLLVAESFPWQHPSHRDAMALFAQGVVYV